MSRFLSLSILAAIVLLMIACIFTSSNTPTNNTFAGETTGVALTIQAQPNSYNVVGQQIAYSFVVTNNTASAIAGPVSVTDDKMPQVTCPALNTIGDKDDNLDAAESITCTATYTITTADIASMSVTDNAKARVGTTDSNSASAVIKLSENKVLVISVTPSQTTYNAANQQITYSYTITNTGAATLGPTQFIVRDDHVPSPINCGTNTVTLATNQTVSCTAVYTTTPADASAAEIVSSVSASGAGAGTIETVKVVVKNSGSSSPNAGNYKKGDTIKHQVSKGEWMLQIARCYGIPFDALQSANPQVSDPDLIFPYPKTTELTVPNIGSIGQIYGPPCVKFYTVKSGDTWDSIANDPAHKADVTILKEANKNVSLSNGVEIKIPLNSKGYGSQVPVTAVPPTTAPPKEPIRLNFNPTSPQVTLSGNINTPETIRYVFAATTGQLLTVKLSTPANDINLAIYGPNASTIQALGTTNSWSGTIPANGDYNVDLVSSLGATTKQYSLEITLTSPIPASPVERVVDINPGPGDSGVSYLSSFNGQLYFQANRNDGAGAELWRYDTGLKALNLVRDINPGPAGSDPAFLTQFGNMLYFRAKNSTDNGGIEVWRFNGTDTGRVTDINKDIADANPAYFAVLNNILYFRATGSDGKGSEIWKYDGINPSRVSDINPDAGDANPAYLTVLNNILYFSATSNDGKGTELWKYDGTNPPSLVADINVGIGSSNPAFLTVLNNVLYFSANGNDNSGTELWKYDGTNPPVRAADINPGPGDSVPTFLTVFNGALYFSANGDASGFELWKFDGTTATRAADINPAGNSNPAYLAVHNNELYFQANANDGVGAELWKYKGP